MTTKLPKIPLPAPTKKRSNIPSPSSSLPIPTESQIATTCTTHADNTDVDMNNHREQKQTIQFITDNISKLKNLSIKSLTSNSSISSKSLQPPSPTISLTSEEIDNDGEEKKHSHSSIHFDDMDIADIYGVPSTNTNDLSWNDIVTDYNYTHQEITGAQSLQHELSKLYKINDANSTQINSTFPPFECIRYFCGCSQEIDRAIKKWTYSIKMYREYEMNKISDIELMECFKLLSKSIAFGGLDKDQCRIITIKYSLFYFSEYKNINIFLLAGFYLFYYLTHDYVAHRNGVCLLCDLNGFSLANFSFTVEKTGIHFFQKVLPIRIKKVFVLDAPWIAHYALKMVLPLLNEKLRKRVFIVTKDELYSCKQDGDKLLDEHQLPQLVGGVFDKKYMEENEGEMFLDNILTEYFKKSIDLKHFDIGISME